MLELIRSWLVGVTCAAMLVALAESLAPPGAVRKAGKLTGGLVLLLAVIQPLAQLDAEALTRSLAEYKLDLSAYSDTLEKENRVLMKAIIEEQAGAYIVDKADALGIACQAAVEADGEGEYPIPVCVTIIGALTPQQRETLTQQIEADFAIPAEQQRYESGGEP